MDTKIPLRIARITEVASGVKCFDLEHVDGVDLPPVEAGGHIELQLPNHLARSYSLLNAPGERHRYRIAVHLSASSSGGSRYMHDSLGEGDVLLASPPRNNFALNESAAHSCLVAGGIGITPLLSMVHRLNELGRSWELHYCARTSAHAAFAQELREVAASSGQKVEFHFDHEPGGRALDLAAMAAAASPQTHLYCCGPKGMLDAFEQATAHCRERAHVEYFTAKSEAARQGGFTVELARSGIVLQVPAGRSILDVVFDAGVSVPSSCREGICGSCETRIVCGEADHRDALLSEEEQAANESMMICCSGAKSERLVLDL
jgi:vanillate O-demethylase ferredoxin subunit